MKLRRLIVSLGVLIVSLLAVDALLKLNSNAMESFGMGVSRQASAESMAAVFLLGLVFGLVGGIVGFFFYLAHREKNLSSDEVAVEQLIAEVALRESLEQEMDKAFEEDTETLGEKSESKDKSEPWERSSDWWKDANS